MKNASVVASDRAWQSLAGRVSGGIGKECSAVRPLSKRFFACQPGVRTGRPHDRFAWTAGERWANGAWQCAHQGALRPRRERLPVAVDGGGRANPGRGGLRQLPVRLCHHHHAGALYGPGNGRLDDPRAGPRSHPRASHRGHSPPAEVAGVGSLSGRGGGRRGAGRAGRHPARAWRCWGWPRWSTPSSTTCWRSSAGSSGWPTKRTSTWRARC